jgi:transmembrane sensor
MSRDPASIPPQIVDAASDWFILMREPSVSIENREAFSRWLRESPVHVGAYLEIARLWADAAHVDRNFPAEPDQHQLAEVVPLREADVKLPASRDHRTEPASRKRISVALAAVILGVCVIIGGTLWYRQQASTYRTEVGEQRVITLEDGSTLRLNSRSAIRVRMSPELRHIELMEGQALFQVEQDSARPFIVKSGAVAIRAVGTQFDVDQKKSGTTVTVMEGRVSVALLQPQARRVDTRFSARPNENSQSGAAAVLSAGEQLRVAQSGAIEPPRKADTIAATSWLKQELHFDGQPLSEVVEEFNRYARIPIVLDDPSLGAVRVNAVFHTTNPDALLRFIARFDAIQVVRSKKEIRIFKRS